MRTALLIMCLLATPALAIDDTPVDKPGGGTPTNETPNKPNNDTPDKPEPPDTPEPPSTPPDTPDVPVTPEPPEPPQPPEPPETPDTPDLPDPPETPEPPRPETPDDEEDRPRNPPIVFAPPKAPAPGLRCYTDDNGHRRVAFNTLVDPEMYKMGRKFCKKVPHNVSDVSVHCVEQNGNYQVRFSQKLNNHTAIKKGQRFCICVFGLD